MKLSELFDKYGSDKNNVHSYGEIYDYLLSDISYTCGNILEIGVQHGGNIRSLSEYFPHSTIYGVDIDKNVLSIENLPSNSKIINIDATIKNDICNNFYGTKFNLIIDDGSHSFNDQIDSFNILQEYLCDGGYYIIEDITEYDMIKRIKSFSQKFVTLDMRSKKGRFDDILMIYRK
jgi:cephalosporin hydroxylase